MSTGSESRPLVLIVEDVPASRSVRIDLFRSIGCAALGAGSHDEALRELRASPGLDLVLCDIHLGKDRNDKSGVALARLIKSLRADLPLIGYSAVFDEDALTEEDREVFDAQYARGSQDEALEKTVEMCRGLAIRHREARLSRAARETATGGPPTPTVRHLVPGPAGIAQIEDELREAGYSLRLVQPEEGNRLRDPLMVWLRQSSEIVEAEVYNHPSLHATGESADTAIASVLSLMASRWAEISAAPASDQDQELQAFLKTVFEG